MVADLSLDKQTLQDVIKKSFKASPEKGAGRKSGKVIQGIGTPELQGVKTSSFDILLSRHSREDRPLRARIKEIAQARVRYGHLSIYVLLRREGWPDNHKRLYRKYKEEGLNLRGKKPGRNRATASRLERVDPLQLYQFCSIVAEKSSPPLRFKTNSKKLSISIYNRY